jgi:high-affinity Fe2+/Pb2+ permease
VPEHPETGREETDSERIDRNLQEMIGELRVALPGVQVLFAFLLVVPFNQRFAEVTNLQRAIYFVTLLLTAAAAICLIAPSAHHRVEFRKQDKEHIVRTGNRIILAGLALLAVAMTGAVVFITDVLYQGSTVYTVGIATAAAFVIFWFLIPLRRLAAGRGASRGSGQSRSPARG